MEVITNSTPDWFWNSESFNEKRLPDTSVFPTFTIPNNKFSASMLRQDTELGQIVNQKHPLERIGYNLFYTNHGGLTNYPNSKLINFTDLGYSSTNYTDENSWSYNLHTERIQWLNGENPLGYDGVGVAGNPAKKAKLRQLIGAALANSPTSEIMVYSWGAVGNLSDWYATSPSTINNLMNPYTNTNLIYSAQIDCGFNAMMQQIYDINADNYDYPAFFIYQCQLKKLKYPNNNIYAVLWLENETVDKFPLLRNMKRKRQDGVFINLSGAKANAPVEYVYNCVLAACCLGKGIFGWEGVMPDLTTEDRANETNGFDVGTNNTQVSVGSDTWVKSNTRVWKSNRLFWDLALYHLSQHKDTIEETNFDWITPDFEYNGVLRTGNFKLVPYNKLYKEPVVQLKYNNNKTKASLLVMNCWGDHTTKTVRVIDGNIDVVVTVNGRKAELYKINL